MLSLTLVATLLQTPTAAEIYDRSQRKLDTFRSVRITRPPNSERDQPTVYIFERPNRGSYSAYQEYGFLSDGKRVNYRDRDTGLVVFRPYEDGDLERMAFLGLESFYRPKHQPKPVGNAVKKESNGKSYWVIQLETESGRRTLDIDAKTFLPAAYQAEWNVNLERRLGFRKPRPAKDVYAEIKASLAKNKGLAFGLCKEDGSGKSWIWALRPNLFRQVSRVETVVANGKELMKRSARGTVTSKPHVGWPRPFFPGLEGFFDPSLTAKVSGMTEIVLIDEEVGYKFRATYPGRGTYELFWTGVLTGYRALSGKSKGATYRYDGIDDESGFGGDSRMFVFDPPDPMTLPQRGSRE